MLPGNIKGLAESLEWPRPDEVGRRRYGLVGGNPRRRHHWQNEVVIRPPHLRIGRQAEGTACLAVRLGEGDLWTKPDRAGHRVRHAQDLAGQPCPKLRRLTDEYVRLPGRSDCQEIRHARARRPHAKEMCDPGQAPWTRRGRIWKGAGQIVACPVDAGREHLESAGLHMRAERLGACERNVMPGVRERSRQRHERAEGPDCRLRREQRAHAVPPTRQRRRNDGC